MMTFTCPFCSAPVNDRCITGTLERCLCGGWYAIQHFPAGVQIIPAQKPHPIRPEQHICTECGMFGECRVLYDPSNKDALSHLCDPCYQTRDRRLKRRHWVISS